ncbi:calcium-binding protein [Pseudomonas gingeri]|uniref:calcium-binding protein n=1 Tax=Pseudomonas gingeri TaxID=117681 RepID=UPI0015A1AB69|nr:calcium-binding protein [Pseudomonas gingeri]NWA02804.1 hypothetical protein [Pseudomonas gingeri]NWA18235.1 hypothetical protein [Pseudomonas gingeri]NWA58975.1 hypothetical protein [Pseudomonas gingeri]NWA99554.1 hypothetical protein [Pseudomonas gingeri]NWB05559.1 hypothetical protein [Pseudomonas gingeri]
MNLINMTSDQVSTLSGLREQGDYPGAYRYLRSLVNNQLFSAEGGGADASSLVKISNWLTAAESINKNDGSFFSDTVRGSVRFAGAASGKIIGDSEFQVASDVLANQVISDVLDRGGIPEAGYIIDADVQSAVIGLKLEKWNWAGTIGDFLPSPFGLGEDYVQVEGDSFSEYMKNLTEAMLQNAAGLSKWLGIDAPIGSVFEWMWGDLGLDKFGQALGSSIYDQISFGQGLIESLKKQFGTAEITRSPLILDLDGDGVQTISVGQGVNFDLDGNGFAEKTGWAGRNDGLLVWDKNGNGKIDSGSELFGNNTKLKSGENAANGFLALADLDENHDGVFDAQDSAFSKLKVWRDLNSDGVVQSGELAGLSESGVSSFDLKYTEPGKADANGDISSSVKDINGNEHRQTGFYTRADGTVAAISDVWFAVDGANTVDTQLVEVSNDIRALPDILGFGNVHSLHQAMARDTTGKLKSLVESFSKETNPDLLHQIVQEIVYRWAGVYDIDPKSRAATQIYGNVIGDARKLATLETFLGESYLGTWCWGARDPNPHGPAAAILLQGFDNLTSAVYDKLMFQTHFGSFLDGLKIIKTNDGVSWDVSSIVGKLKDRYDSNEAAGQEFFKTFGESLSGLGSFGLELLSKLRGVNPTGVVGFDNLMMGIGIRSLVGGSGNDVINGTDADDVILGNAGGDRIYGGAGDDHLVGGVGDDYLVGGDGSDTYHFSRGDGHDTILNADQDAEGTKLDRLVFGVGIKSSDVSVKRNYYDLVVQVDGGAESVTIQSYFDEDTVANHGYAVDEIVFSDGTVWSVHDVKAMLVRPTDGDDQILGYRSDDVLFGGLGNDTILGNDGDDLITGGKGNDFLVGGSGADVYHFEIGDGKDVILETFEPQQELEGKKKDRISFGQGINASDLNFEVGYGADGTSVLQISYPGGVISVVEGMLGAIGAVTFSDGSSVELSSLIAQSPIKANLGDLGHEFFGSSRNDEVKGGTGNDKIYGGDGADTLLGGQGNDLLFGGAGDDWLDGGSGSDRLDGGEGNNTFVFSKYMGQDTWIAAEGSLNTVLVSKDISPSELLFERSGDDLVVSYLYESASNTRLTNYFSNPGLWNISYGGASPLSLSQAIDSSQANPLSQTDYYAGIFKERILNGHVRQLLIDGYEGRDGLYSYNKVLVQGRITYYQDSKYDVRFVEGALQRSVGGMQGGNGENAVLSSYFTESTESSTFEQGSTYSTSYRNSSGGLSYWTFKSTQILVEAGENDPDVKFINHYSNNSSVITYSVIKGGDVGGRYNVQGGNGYIGGKGDDKIVAYAFNPDDPIGEGTFLAGGEGNDTLVGNWGDDFLLGGAGTNYLSGGDGRDTYIIDGNQTKDIIVDINLPVRDWMTGRWSYPNNSLGSSDVVVLPGGVKFTDLSFSWGAEVVEDIDGYRISAGYSGTSSDGIRVATQKTTLDIRWGTDHLVRIAMPNSTDFFSTGIEYIQLASGERISTAELIRQAGIGTAPDLHENGMNVTYNGLVQLSSASNDLSFSGGKGNDFIRATHGETIFGREGDDVLEGTNLVGGEGNDTFSVYKFSGEPSRGYFDGGAGDDIYFFGASDAGGEVIVGGGYDGIVFNEGVDLSRLSFHRQDNSLLILVDGDLDHSISVANHFADNDSRLSYVKTSANEFLDFNQIDSLLSPLPEPPGPIFGTDGDDTLIGTNKNDVIIGGKGNDFLSGLGGHDFYEFSLGDGQDIIYNDSLNPDQEEDILAIVGGSKFDVWLSRQDQSLVLDFLGGDDKITIKDWYASDSHKLDSVMMGSEVLYSQQVDMLVEAMSSFGVPASGSIELTPDQRDRMDMVIANSWQRLGGGGGTDVPK